MSEWQYQRKERWEEILGTAYRCQVAMPKKSQTVKMLCSSTTATEFLNILAMLPYLSEREFQIAG